MAEATNVKVNPAQKLVTLADVIRGRKDMPDRIVVHGLGGIGKTSFAAYAPKPFFFMSRSETGLLTLMKGGLVPECPNIEIPNWKSTIPVLDELLETGSQYETLVVDTADGFFNLCCEHVVDKEYAGSASEFARFGQGLTALNSRYWPKFLIALDRIRAERNVCIIMLCHNGIAKWGDTVDDYNRWTPAMHKHSWTMLHNWADMTLYAHRDLEVKKGPSFTDKAKVTITASPHFHTDYSPEADAKNRHNLPPEISLGNSGQEAWNNLQQAILEGRKNAAKGA